MSYSDIRVFLFFLFDIDHASLTTKIILDGQTEHREETHILKAILTKCSDMAMYLHSSSGQYYMFVGLGQFCLGLSSQDIYYHIFRESQSEM